MNDANHPIWSLLTLVVYCITLTVVLMIFASEFDYTEWRTILTVLLGSGAFEFAKHKWIEKRKASTPKPMGESFPKLDGNHFTEHQP